MILDTVNRSLQITLGEARTIADCDITACYAQSSGIAFVPVLAHTASNGTTPVIVVAAPPSGAQFQVNEVRVHNGDSVTHTVTLQLADGATTRVIYTGSVAAGADWVYTPRIGGHGAVSSVAGRSGDVTLTHNDIADWTSATAGFGAGTSGVASFNTRTGTVTLTSADVTTALTFTPYNATNPSGFQTAANVNTTLAAPPAIGSGTPAAGSFTTLSASSTVSGVGFTALLSSYALSSAIPAASSTTPAMDGTAAAGTGTTWARADHVHPTDTSRAPLASPTLTGTPAAPTATTGTNTTQIATTAFVNASVTAGAYTLPTATATVLGGVKPDGTTISNTAGALSVTYGTAASTAAQGNDSRITGALSAATAASTYAPLVATAASVSTTGGTTNLTSTQYNNPILLVTGTLASNATLVVPNTGLWTVTNGTSGAFTLTVKTASGTGVTVAQGYADTVIANGTNVLYADNDLSYGPVIVGGSINNTTIGATTATTVRCTTLTSTQATGTAPFTVSSTTNVANLNASSLNGATFAAPGSIGSTTPGSGAFTTFSASGQITSTATTGTAPFVVASTTNVANLNASSLSGATFASPGSIGSTTPGSGAFTTLSASSTISGSGFSTYLASPPAIGGTAAAAGSFTTLGASGLITPSSTIGIKGTGTNDNAQAGSIGEYVSASVSSGAAVSLTTAVAANLTSISLTAGDWDVSANVVVWPASTTVLASAQGAISSSSASLPSPPCSRFAEIYPASYAPNSTLFRALQPIRMSLSVTTTIYLVVFASFSTSTCSCYGHIAARRMR